MQMVNMCSAVNKHSSKGLFYVSIITNKTFGGASASFVTMADVIIAHKNSLFGFTGKGILESTMNGKIPEDFQTAEFSHKNGAVDMVIDEEEISNVVSKLLKIHNKTRNTTTDISMMSRYLCMRPNSRDYIGCIFDDFIEMAGDRISGNDPSIIAGVGYLSEIPVTIIGQLQGRNIDEKIKYNFSMTTPEGFRKALRLIKQAEKFNRPVICFVDTIGADPSVNSEMKGQAVAIAENISKMISLRVPIISILIGSGYSGGALAFMVADQIIALRDVSVGVISPGAYAQIIWKDSGRSEEAKSLLKTDSSFLLEHKIVDVCVDECKVDDKYDIVNISNEIKANLMNKLKKLCKMRGGILRYKRQKKFRLLVRGGGNNKEQ